MPNLSRPITGNQSTTALGNLGVAFDLTLAITGEQSNVAAGNLGVAFDLTLAITGEQSNVAAGNLGVAKRILTQPRAYGPMTGRRYGSFGSKRLSLIAGQWANVLSLESYQPTIELHGQERIALGSLQEIYIAESPVLFSGPVTMPSALTRLTQPRAWGPMTGMRYGRFGPPLDLRWANVFALESHQPKITLYGQERVTVGQERYTVELL